MNVSFNGVKAMINGTKRPTTPLEDKCELNSLQPLLEYSLKNQGGIAFTTLKKGIELNFNQFYGKEISVKTQLKSNEVDRIIIQEDEAGKSSSLIITKKGLEKSENGLNLFNITVDKLNKLIQILEEQYKKQKEKEIEEIRKLIGDDAEPFDKL